MLKRFQLLHILGELHTSHLGELECPLDSRMFCSSSASNMIHATCHGRCPNVVNMIPIKNLPCSMAAFHVLELMIMSKLFACFPSSGNRKFICHGYNPTGSPWFKGSWARKNFASWFGTHNGFLSLKASLPTALRKHTLAER